MSYLTRKPANFVAPWWLRNRHLQSCFNSLFPLKAKTQLTWEQLELPDGDFIDLCWAGTSTTKVVVLLHGLEGSVNSHYIQTILDGIVDSGWRVVLMHFRTCSGRLNRLSRSYHAGDIGDFDFLLQTIRTRFPEASLSAVGFSIGGNVLLHYLVTHTKSILRSAIAISVPFEMKICANYLSPFYEWTLLHTMKEKTTLKIKNGYEMPVGINDLKKIDNFYQFDDAITAPLHGFNNVNDYYEKVSIRSRLRKINHPTLIIHAMDDPLVAPECVPERSELSTTTYLELQKQGGHVGFIQGKPWHRENWLMSHIVEFLKRPLRG